MTVTWSRLLAAAIALGYVITGLIAGVPLLAIAFIAPPLVLIWYPEIGSSWPRKKTVLYTYEDEFPYRRPGRRDSHPWVVALMGWFFLIGLPLVVWLIRSSAAD